MRVLVCGGRDFTDKAAIAAALQKLHISHPIALLIHGAARGTDTLAAAWAEQNGLAVQSFPADWNRLGRAAGPFRNQQMLRIGKPDLVLAFPGGKGTRNMLEQAQTAGLTIIYAETSHPNRQ